MTGVLTVAGGIAVGAAMLPEEIGVRPVSTTLPSMITAPRLACTGPETLVVPDGGKAVSPEAGVLVSALLSSDGPAGASVAARGQESGTIRQLSEALPESDVAVHPGRELLLDTGRKDTAVGALSTWALGPVVVTGDSEKPQTVPELAAVQSTVTGKGDLRGLSASRCDQSSADAWLVGGGTVTGERLRLVLSNPTAATSVVDVVVLGEGGRVEAPSGVGVVVPAGRQTPLFVDALAPGQERVAVHVVARNGQVIARMHDSVLRGLVAGGVDVVSPAAAPAKRQIVPGISLVNGYSKTAGDTAAPGSTSIRVAVPGSEEAVVRVRLLGSTGEIDLPTSGVVNVPGGGVADVPVSGIASGTYTAVVDADVPVIAGARVGRPPAAGHQATEFGWAPATSVLEDSGYAVLPPGTRSTVSLASPGRGGSLTLTPLDAGGETLEPIDVHLKDGTAAAFALDEKAAAFRVSRLDGGPVAASVVSTGSDDSGTTITVLGVDPARSGQAPSTAIADTRVGLR
ncbi:hypothetical protein KIH74_15445 [Kineosporia sp. J2-2]|uniref:Secreted protein n=1 Tax=Kineosporia corallincola TaxID=2835133 RepID=A0ABS5TJF2_9ACTN|nr:DUF5719 family protein [Kineosporia corallincola]MBT0770336.1 hypothetical protein [Kineosporia corallincola]